LLKPLWQGPHAAELNRWVWIGGLRANHDNQAREDEHGHSDESNRSLRDELSSLLGFRPGEGYLPWMPRDRSRANSQIEVPQIVQDQELRSTIRIRYEVLF